MQKHPRKTTPSVVCVMCVFCSMIELFSLENRKPDVPPFAVVSEIMQGGVSDVEESSSMWTEHSRMPENWQALM